MTTKRMDELRVATWQGLGYIAGGGVLAALAAFIMGFQAIAYGLVLGSVMGMVSFVQLRYQINKCATMAPAAAAAYIQTGWFIRLALIVATLIISIAVPQISFIAALCGLMAVWVFLLAYAIVKILKSSK